MPTDTDRIAALERRVAELADREAIRDCLMRYCQGVDRFDEAALRSAYWPDATDRHGPYQGTASGFIDWAVQKLSQGGGRNVHMIGNIAIELRGEVAAVESYFHALQAERPAEGPPRDLLLCGRYVDRFERRGGEWRVAARVVTYDWMQPLPVEPGSEAERFGVRQPLGARKPDDPWYVLLASLPAD
ncbi:MAG: nuclear transport factor 2 family protein [Variovorax sp.]|nr:nuclear transport factor 2 family protein [Variovorax sp.]